MKVLKHHVLVKPEVKKSSLIVDLQAERGEVVVAGEDCEVGAGDSVIFGEETEELNLAIDGQPVTYLLMHQTNVKVYFSKDK